MPRDEASERNSFVMAFRVETVLALLRDRLPAVDALLRALGSEGGYRRVRSWNFSTDFLTRIPDKLAVVPLEGVSWSDWGTPEAVEQTLVQIRQAMMCRRLPLLLGCSPSPGEHDTGFDELLFSAMTFSSGIIPPRTPSWP